MQGTSMTCDGCGRRIEDLENPVIVYLVAGIAPLHQIVQHPDQSIQLQDYEMPQELRDLFDNGNYGKEARVELCAQCFATIFRSKQIGPDHDKNTVTLKEGRLVKDLSRPKKAVAGRIPLPAALHQIPESVLRDRFPLLQPRLIPEGQLPQDAKPSTKRRARKAAKAAEPPGEG